MTSTYSVVRNRPVAMFRYKGTHSKPVRRTVVLTEITPKCLTGYEIREGNITRSIDDEVIKSFNRDEVMGLERCALSALKS